MKSKLSTDSHRLLRRSNSDTGLHERSRVEDAEASLTPSSNPSSNLGARLQPCRPTSYRSISISQIEACSGVEGMTSKKPSGQQEIVARLGGIQQTDTLKRSKRREESGVSSPDSRTNSGTSSRMNARRPLKTCLKQKAQRAKTTSPDEPVAASRSSVEDLKLRRVKTVEFEKPISDHAYHQRRFRSSGTRHGRTRPGNISKDGNSCPGIALLARRSPACPAVTRTDVHVVATAAPSSKPGGSIATELDQVEEADGATPTMQVVESGNGRYEITWGDVPIVHSSMTRRCSSLACHALEAASTGTRDLERVNTKLTEWSGTWNTPSGSFQPSIIVFPDDDGCRSHFECAIVDDEDIEIFAPPKTERVSAIHSRRTSRPTSARMSRAASHDGVTVASSPQKTPLDGPKLHTERILAVPDPGAWPVHLTASHRKLPVGVRNSQLKLSDVTDMDPTFRNHRDSLTLAHSRLVRSGALSPELFAHRDSVMLARKRMHAKNYQRASRAESKSEPSQQLGDEAT